MSTFRRAWSSISLSSSSSTSASIPMRRQEAPRKYLLRGKLQAFLEKKFPNHPRLDFHIHLHEDIFSFDAPFEVTEDELEALGEFQ